MNGLAEIRRANAPTLFRKRHYQFVADAIRACRELPHDDPQEAWTDLVQTLCDRFARDNPEFRADTFRAAAFGAVNGHRFTEANR